MHGGKYDSGKDKVYAVTGIVRGMGGRVNRRRWQFLKINCVGEVP